MRLYDEVVETGEEITPNEHSVDLSTTLEKLEESITRLNENIEKSTEEASEAASEEASEEASTEILEEELPLQKKDMMELKESVDSVAESVDKLVKMEQAKSATEETTEESSELVYLDETVDNHLYLTSQVENATMDDLYTMTLSIRNVCVLALLLGLSLFFFKLVRTGLERMLNR